MTRCARRALGPALVLFAQHTGAVALGEIEVRSALGEPLEARIPLTIAEGEAVDAACFTLARAGGNEALPQLAEGILTIDAAGVPPALRVRSAARLFEPALAVRVRAACSGDAPVERQYVVLLDPRPGTAGVEVLPAVAATISSRPGDSLRSIAAQVFPQERAARTQYLDALRELNPSLASTPPGAALAEGTAVALPDLRSFAKSTPRRQPSRGEPAVSSELAPAAPKAKPPRLVAAPKEAAPPQEATAPRIAPPAQAAAAKAAAPRAAAPTVAPPTKATAAAKAGSAPDTIARSAPAGSTFVLKLSSAEVDLSRTRGIDDRKRAQLRERQLVLDSDDQVAALLSLRNSMKQLESRVADLQLKLAGMPAALAVRSEAAASAPPPAKAAPPAASRPEPPKPLPPRIEATGIETAKAVPPTPAPAMAEAPRIEQAKPEPPKAEMPLPAVATPGVAAPAPKAAAAERPPVAAPPGAKADPPPQAAPGFDWRALAANPWLWAGILALAAGVLGLLAWRRRGGSRESEDALPDEEILGAERALDDQAQLIAPRDTRTPERPAMASDAGLSTRLGEDSRELRRRYIEERFPEIANRTLALEDAGSIVKGARLFYEDGALPRAVELLQFAIEDRPAEVRPWLALFEIFRLELLTGEFAALARRFHEQHGNTEHWRKVQYFGREIDPTDPLYREDAINTLETIGPREARRIAAAGAAVDPIAENWLDAPMDFENEVLANELRQSLMAAAGLTELDLVPNPMPALRSAEMFTVA